MQEKKKFYQAKWFLWLWLIVFPPVGIILLWAVHKGMSKKTKIILSVVFVIWFAILMSATKGGSTDNGTQTEQGENMTESNFAEDVKNAIQGDVGENEVIKDVTFENKELCVYVDFSKVDPAPLTIEDLAISRTSSITDAILELKQYDDLWETITVDFGEVGKIKNEKAGIQENENGGRYFPSEDFKLQ